MALERIHMRLQVGNGFLNGPAVVDATELLEFVKRGGLLELRGNVLEIDGDADAKKEVLGYQRGVVGNAWFALPFDAFYDKQRGIRSGA